MQAAKQITEKDLKELLHARGEHLQPAEDVTETASRYVANLVKQEKVNLPGLRLKPEEEEVSRVLLDVAEQALKKKPFKKPHASGG